MNKKKRIYNISRRDFLKGLGALSIPLPIFDFMLNFNGTAFAAGNGLPCRMLAVKSGITPSQDFIANRNAQGIYVPATGPHTRDFIARYSSGELVCPNGYPRNLLTPQNFGANLGNLYGASPLNNYNELKPYVSFFSNSRVPWVPVPQTEGTFNVNLPPGGAQGSFHIIGSYPMVTGRRVGVRTATRRFYLDDNGKRIYYLDYTYNRNLGPSWDQLLKAEADAQGLNSLIHGNLTLINNASREDLTLQHGNNGQVLGAVNSPRQLFRSIFENGTPLNSGPDPQVEFELKKRKSILDLLDKERLSFLNRELGTTEKIILSDHLDHIRELERRVAAIDPGEAQTCEAPNPIANDPNRQAIPVGYTQTMDLYIDIIAKAMACDRMRFGTLRMNGDGTIAGFPTRHFTNIPVDLHVLSHSNTSGTNLRHMEVVTEFFTTQFYKLAEALRNTPEGSGNVLDNTALVFYAGGGPGPSMEGSISCHAHCVENLTFITAGKAGSLVGGVHRSVNKAHPAALFYTLMKQVGYQGNALGEINTLVPEMITA